MPLSRPRFRISHTRFTLAFAALLYVACNALNIGRLARWFRDADGIDFSALCAYLLAGLCLFIVVFTLLAHRRTIKPAAILLTVLSAAATYFISKYGVAIDSSMVLNAVHTDRTEVGQLLSVQMIPYVVLLMLLPIALILAADITFAPAGRYLLGSLKTLAVALCVALALLGVEYGAIFRAGNVSNKYIVYSLVPINIISSSVNAMSKAARPYLRRQQKDIEISAKVAAPGNLVVVLAVGESSRRRNFSLYGYQRRETNPVLKQIPGLQLLDAVATRASTLYALPKILEKDGIKLTTVVSRAGVPTVCYVNYTLYDNCAAVGETKVDHCGHGGKCYDEDVVPLLEKDLAAYQSGYRFVVLHLGGGSHGPAYADRHPPEFRKFQPMCTDADVANQCSAEQLYNSYDNTILYVDYVLGQAIGALDRSGVPYVFIYLSDHGESLMEGGYMFHGVPPGMALPPEQAQIPLIVKSSVPVSIDRRAEYGQPDVFDTVLELFSIETAKFDEAGGFMRRDLTSDRAAEPRSSRASDGMPPAVAAPATRGDSNGPASAMPAGVLPVDALPGDARRDDALPAGAFQAAGSAAGAPRDDGTRWGARFAHARRRAAAAPPDGRRLHAGIPARADSAPPPAAVDRAPDDRPAGVRLAGVRLAGGRPEG
jgi:lipid A ethanolaminephosphotransferase